MAEVDAEAVASPGSAEGFEARSSALGTRTGAGGQVGRFVEEVQAGVMARCHRRSPAHPELQQAQQPAPDLPGAPHAVVIVVEDATVAEERAPIRRGDEVVERRDAILTGHVGLFALPPTISFLQGICCRLNTAIHRGMSR